MRRNLMSKNESFIEGINMRKAKRENGVLSLEASIVVTMFLFLMLFLYSFFGVFEARNQMAHVLLATTDSLALDPYESAKFSNAGDTSQVLYMLYGVIEESQNDGFSSTADWSNMPGFGFDETGWSGTIYVEGSDSELLEPDDYGNAAATSGTLKRIIEERFLAYLADGSEDEANRILEKYHIRGGWKGLDFSGSKVSSGKIYIKIKYTLEYEFNFFDLACLDVEQSACSKIWK